MTEHVDATLFEALVPRKVEQVASASKDTGESVSVISESNELQRWSPPRLTAGSCPSRHSSSAFISDFAVTGEAGTEAAETDIEAIKQQAYQEGFSQGLADAETQSKQLLAEQSQRLQQAIAALREPQAVIDEQLQDELVQMTLCLSQQLLRRELYIKPELLKQMVEQSIKQLPVLNRPLQIYLNPEDVQVLRDLHCEAEQNSDWQLLEDPALARGGYRIHSGDSTLDESLETRLAGLVDRLSDEEN